MAIKLSRLVEIDLQVEPGMDPRLQRAQMQRKSGRRGRKRGGATGEWEVAVAARVRSARQWQRTPHVKSRSVLGRARGGGVIVTGRIDADRLAAVRRAPGVLSLKASQPLRPQLADTLQSMRVRPDLLPPGVKPRGGAGVIVGIIDIGGDFAHPNFRKHDGRTRLLSLWHQDGATRRGDDVLYGRAFSSTQIDRALGEPNPYRKLGYKLDDREEKGTHGTHVMDVVAGNGRGTRQAGVAPEADLIFVDISQTDAARAGTGAFGYFMGDSVMMLEALAYIFRRARRRPCVVNLSLGSNGGPHDGSSLVEQGIDALVRAQPNRAVVVAAGNAQKDRAHAQGTIAPRAGKRLAWKVPASGGELECWYGGGLLQVTLVGPDGTEFRPVCPGSSATFGIGKKPYIFIANRLRDPNNGMNQVNIWLDAGLPAGNWSVRLRSLSRAPIDWHAWIERALPQPSFRGPQATHTLGSISTGFQSIVVGAYNAHRRDFPLSPKSSSGQTRDGRPKPDLSAPGHEVSGARSRRRSVLVARSGTSMAAPAVSGLVALIYAEARRRGRSLTIRRLRDRLLRRLDRSPPAGRGWHPRYGLGRANARSI